MGNDKIYTMNLPTFLYDISNAMSYINVYSPVTFNRMLLLHKRKFFLTKLRMAFLPLQTKQCSMFCFDTYPFSENIKTEAKHFMKIDENEFQDFIDCFFDCNNEARLSNEYNAVKLWMDSKYNRQWLALNIYIQMSAAYNYIYSCLAKNLKKDMRVADWGCGSAVLSFCLDKIIHFKELDLYEFDNYISTFLKYYINHNDLLNTSVLDITKTMGNKKYDAIICIDVLEHLEKPFDKLLEFDSVLSKNGFLILKIAFEHPEKTHLPQSAENFLIKNDGYVFLNKFYKKILNFDHKLISGIYVKRS
jgi:2-polyprenyl-3-methyl-5-hydroxy-6-metoxy-1,4-benzoquinol methylase